MTDPGSEFEHEDPKPEGLMDRRRFIGQVGALGLSLAALPAFLAACARGDGNLHGVATSGQPAQFPTPTPVETMKLSPTPNRNPSVAVVAPRPTATPASLPSSETIPTPTPKPAKPSQPRRPAKPTTSNNQTTPTPTPAPQLPSVSESAESPAATKITFAGPESDAERISHLLRRAGFGANHSELARYRSLGLAGTIDELVNPERIDDSALESWLSEKNFNLEENYNHMRAWWLNRMIRSKRPLVEKLTLFWHGILTSDQKKAGRGPMMIDQNELFRTHALGRYDVLLKAVGRDPAMMLYLDSRSNKKKSPNENYSRELMELFTLGLGQFSEDDVRESARAFTGWELRRTKREGNKNYYAFRFNKKQHDTGYKVFLDKAGPFDGDYVVDIIMEKPAAAEFVVTRLWSFFAYPNPEPEIVKRLAKIFRDNKTEIRPVMKAMFAADEFYSAAAYRSQLKGPVELLVGTLRSLAVAAEHKNSGVTLSNISGRMGQTLLQPPNVAGWPGGRSWINSSTLLERVNWAHTISSNQTNRFAFDPAVALGGDLPDELPELINALADLLLGTPLSKVEHEAIHNYLYNAIQQARVRGIEFDKARALTYVLMASPGYQLA